jgi:hypothetical protein
MFRTFGAQTRKCTLLFCGDAPCVIMLEFIVRN